MANFPVPTTNVTITIIAIHKFLLSLSLSFLFPIFAVTSHVYDFSKSLGIFTRVRLCALYPTINITFSTLVVTRAPVL
jgi:hypothetical protein